MGQGQSEYALQQLKECAAWVPVLEKEVNTLKPHKNFRLWLTAEPHVKFPLVLLESSLKVTYESPPGIKKNLYRTYEAWSPEFIERGHNPTRAQALFTLAWFHAIVQERRNYIPQGWTKFYEFSQADLRSGADIIDRLCTGTGSIQWDFIHGLFENAVFGGRIDNNYDLEVLRAYLRQYFDREVLGGKGRRKLAGVLELPQSINHKDFVKAISALPDIDSPSVFSLPSNIDRSQQRSVAKTVIAQLARWTKELTPFLQLWKRLNQGSDIVKMGVEQISAPKENDPPLLTFLLLERKAAIVLLQKVHGDLSKISKVLRGSLLLGSDIRDNATALLRHEVPSAWVKKWEGPEAPIDWLRSLVSKTMALGGWVEKCNSGSLLSSPVDLSDLMNPGVFLNALRQESARRLGQPINNLVFMSQWGGSTIKKAVCPVMIEGLMIEGALYDGNSLVECQRDSPSCSPISNCTIAWGTFQRGDFNRCTTRDKYRQQETELSIFPGCCWRRQETVREVLGGKGRRKLAGVLELPQSINHKDFVKAISALPDIDSPSVFSLPSNIDRSQQRSVAKAVIAQLVLVGRTSVEDSSFDKARWTKELTPFLQLWKRLNQGSDIVKMGVEQVIKLVHLLKKFSIPLLNKSSISLSGAATPSELRIKWGLISAPKENDPPLLTFLLLERKAAIVLLQKVHGDLSKISKVLRGSLLLGSDIRDNATALLRHEVPSAWVKKWEGPEAPIDWLRSLVSKTMALGGWVEKCNSGSLLSSPVDLSDLMNPGVFLNALRQESARRLGQPINNLVFMSQWGGSTIKKAVCPRSEGNESNKLITEREREF
eukprot:sb/3462095/